jgi:intraflagellar transport protein 74
VIVTINFNVAGRGRVVQDSTFFSTEIRHKINLVTTELSSLKHESDVITRENSNLSSFEKRADLLSEDLRELQGQLGDLNTLVDRLNADADLEDIERSFLQLREKNQRENKVLDEAFSFRQQKENEIQEVEMMIEREMKKSEKLINDLVSFVNI